MSAYQIDPADYCDLARLIQKLANAQREGAQLFQEGGDGPVKFIQAKGLHIHLPDDTVRKTHGVGNSISSWEMVNILQAENAHSVAVRYREEPQACLSITSADALTPTTELPTINDCSKLCGLLDRIGYNACEADDYHLSAASRIIDALYRYGLQAVRKANDRT